MNSGAPKGNESSGENPCKSSFLMLDNSTFERRELKQNVNTKKKLGCVRSWGV